VELGSVWDETVPFEKRRAAATLCIEHHEREYKTTGEALQIEPATVQIGAMRGLELKGQGRRGRGNVFADYGKTRDWWLALRASLLMENGTKSYLAFEEVAKRSGVDARTVERAWKKWEEAQD
jgi:hypothetical protein